MTRREAYNAMLNGPTKITHPGYKPVYYVHWPVDSMFTVDSDGEISDVYNSDGYEIYEEPTYTLQEVFDKGEGHKWGHDNFDPCHHAIVSDSGVLVYYDDDRDLIVVTITKQRLSGYKYLGKVE